jgi:hypothetical protein
LADFARLKRRADRRVVSLINRISDLTGFSDAAPSRDLRQCNMFDVRDWCGSRNPAKAVARLATKQKLIRKRSCLLRCEPPLACSASWR